MRRMTAGFTLVEILIVIVVISILASITIVSYNGVQSRSRDTKIRVAAKQIQGALEVFISQNGRIPKGGSGSTQALTNNECSDGVNGWFGKGTYTCTVEESLVAANLIPSNLISDLPPNKVSGNLANRVFMLYSCGSSQSILLWYLESPTADDIASYDNSYAVCPGTDWRGLYGMRAATLIDR